MTQGNWEHIGTFNYARSADATDPCYDRETYSDPTRSCGVAGIGLFGERDGWARMIDDPVWGRRVAELLVCTPGYDDPQAFKDEHEGEWWGTVGVDSGSAGVFCDKPDFKETGGWNEFADILIDEGYYAMTPYGFCTESGYGDGGYDCIVYDSPDRTRITGVGIVYIPETEPED